MIDVNGIKFSMGNYLIGVLNDMKEFPKHDWDCVNLVVGEVGDGKTSFVKLASLYLDNNITINQWAYNSEQFKSIIDSDLPPGSNIVWDESDELTDSWNSKVIQTVSRLMKRIRSKRYIIWLITPTMFDMRKFFVIVRTRCLFDVYAKPRRNDTGKFEANRGFVRFFSKDKKRLLYIRGIKEWNMNATLPDFHEAFGKVPDNYPISSSELDAKKDAATKEILAEEGKEPLKVHKYRAGCVSRFQQWMLTNYNKKPTNFDAEFIFQVSARQFQRDIVAFDKEFALKGGDVPVLDALGDESLSEQGSKKGLKSKGLS